MFRAVIKAFWIEIVFLGILGFFVDFIITLGSSIVLKAFLACFQYGNRFHNNSYFDTLSVQDSICILNYFRENSGNHREGAIKYGLYVLILTICYGVGFLHYFYYGAYYAMKIRIALSSLIYRKVC